MKEQFRDNFVTSCNNLAILKASPTKLCHYTNQNIADLTVQKNPVKFLATQHFRHISIFTNFDKICRLLIKMSVVVQGYDLINFKWPNFRYSNT